MEKNNQINDNEPVKFAADKNFYISPDRMDRFTSDASDFEIVYMPSKKKAKKEQNK